MNSQVPPYYISYIAQTLVEMGVDTSHWLAQCGADQQLLTNENFWLPVEQYLALANKAIELSDSPDIGLRVGNKLGIGSHGMLGFALLNCEDLEQAIRLLDRYINTRTPLLKTSINISDKGLSIALIPAFPMPKSRRAFLETATVSFCNLFAVLTAQQGLDVIKSVQFDYQEPEYSGEYKHYLPVECAFDAPECKIVLNHNMLHHHFSQADEVTLNNLVGQFEAQLLRLDGNAEAVQDTSDFGTRVRHIMENEHHRIPTLEEVAKVLFVTPRTLHRRLRQENTSFRALLVDVKKQQSIKYLEHTNMTVQDIAWSLGYDDVANFRRAFKSWTQKTPKEFRATFTRVESQKGMVSRN